MNQLSIGLIRCSSLLCRLSTEPHRLAQRTRNSSQSRPCSRSSPSPPPPPSRRRSSGSRGRTGPRHISSSSSRRLQASTEKALTPANQLINVARWRVLRPRHRRRRLLYSVGVCLVNRRQPAVGWGVTVLWSVSNANARNVM